MTTQSNVCLCETCAGTECTCGCQSAAPQTTTASCQCGESCDCGDTCTCSNRQHGNTPVAESR